MIFTMNINFTDKKISVGRAIAILAKNGIKIDDDEARVIVDFLYLMAKNQKVWGREDAKTLRRNRTLGKVRQQLP